MKKGLKNFLMLCGILVIVGIIFTCIGYALGGVPNVSLGKWNVISLNFNNHRLDDYIAKEDKNIDDFRNIKVDTDFYDIELIPSSEYRVKYTYIEDLKVPKISVENGTLYFKAEDNDDKSFLKFFNNDKQRLSLKIFYPKEKKFEKIDIDNGLGNVKVAELNCDSLDMNIDLGAIKLIDVIAQNTNLDLELGDIETENLISEGIIIDNEKGNVELGGKLAGKTEIECEMGNVEIETSLSQEEYNYSLNINLGNVTVNGTTIEFGSVSNFVEAENDITVNCELGDIDIDFGK